MKIAICQLNSVMNALANSSDNQTLIGTAFLNQTFGTITFQSDYAILNFAMPSILDLHSPTPPLWEGWLDGWNTPVSWPLEVEYVGSVDLQREREWGRMI